jgi:hypothetical protein
MMIGRVGYDNWLIYYCRSNNIKVIDASEVVTAIHQNHNYSHLAKGKTEAWTGIEAQSNIALAGGYDNIFTIIDADWRFTSKGLVKNRCRGNLRRLVKVFLILRKDSVLGKLGLFSLRAVRYLLDNIYTLLGRGNISRR